MEAKGSAVWPARQKLPELSRLQIARRVTRGTTSRK